MFWGAWEGPAGGLSVPLTGHTSLQGLPCFYGSHAPCFYSCFGPCHRHPIGWQLTINPTLGTCQWMGSVWVRRTLVLPLTEETCHQLIPLRTNKSFCSHSRVSLSASSLPFHKGTLLEAGANAVGMRAPRGQDHVVQAGSPPARAPGG